MKSFQEVCVDKITIVPSENDVVFKTFFKLPYKYVQYPEESKNAISQWIQAVIHKTILKRDTLEEFARKVTNPLSRDLSHCFACQHKFHIYILQENCRIVCQSCFLEIQCFVQQSFELDASIVGTK